MSREIVLKYQPALRSVARSVNATILMGQLEYWFSKKGNGFYKFLEPCEHPFYREGDSWEEELMMSSSEIRCAFKYIGVAYKSKRAFEKSEDKFQGKMYASYYDRMRKLTYYLRNDALVISVMKRLEGNREGERCDVEELAKEEMVGKRKCGSINEACEDGISVDYFNKLQIKNKRLTSLIDVKKIKVPFEAIRDLFNKICTSQSPIGAFTTSQMQKLSKLWEEMGQDLAVFRQAFEKIEASDFLSDRVKASRWQLQLNWLFKKQHFCNVLGDRYINYDVKFSGQGEAESTTQEMSPIKSRVGKFYSMLSHNWDFDELERMEEAYIDDVLAKRGGIL